MIKDLLIDKGFDVLVVTLGVLLALSVGSCRERIKDKRQWRSFSVQLQEIIKNENRNSKKDLIEYENRISRGEELIQKLETEKVEMPEVLKYLDGLGIMNLSYPSQNLYEAFLKLNNPYLTKDYEYYTLVDEFFNFSEIAKIFLDMHLNQVIPEFRNSFKINKMWNKNLNLRKNPHLAEELIFLIRSYLGLLKGLKIQVEGHVERSDKLIHYKKTS